MLRLTVGVLLLVSFPVVNAQVVPRPGSELSIIDPSTANWPPYTDEYEAALTPITKGMPVPMSSLPAHEQVRSESFIPVDAVRLDLRMLRQMDRSTQNSKRRQDNFLTLNIAGTKYVLYPLQSWHDKAYGLRHVTTKIVNHGRDAYARFTIDDRSGNVVATLRGDATAFRMVSSSLDGAQVVYRMDTYEESRHDYGRRSLGASTELEKIETRHVLAEALAHYQTAYYRANGLTVHVYGDDKGRDNLGVHDPSTMTTSLGLAHLLHSLNPIVPATGKEQYVIEGVTHKSVEKSDFQATEIKFRQMIDGLPVNKLNRLLVSDTGRILEIHVTVLDPAEWVPKDVVPLATESDAPAIAEKALLDAANAGEIAGPFQQLGEHTYLRYDIVVGNRLVPMWQSVFRGRDEFHFVRVNLLTGDVSIGKTTEHISTNLIRQGAIPSKSDPIRPWFGKRQRRVIHAFQASTAYRRDDKARVR